MLPYQERVVDEKKELDDKTMKLKSFMGTEAFRGLVIAERVRMQRQLVAMAEYSWILQERIDNFPK